MLLAKTGGALSGGLETASSFTSPFGGAGARISTSSAHGQKLAWIYWDGVYLGSTWCLDRTSGAWTQIHTSTDAVFKPWRLDHSDVMVYATNSLNQDGTTGNYKLSYRSSACGGSTTWTAVQNTNNGNNPVYVLNIGVGHTHVWMTKADYSILYFRRGDETSGTAAQKAVNSFGGLLVNLDVGALVWGVNSYGQVYYTFPDGSGTWNEIYSPCTSGNKAVRVSAGATRTWAICTDGTLRYWSNSLTKPYSLTVDRWVTLGSSLYGDMDADHGMPVSNRCTGSNCVVCQGFGNGDESKCDGDLKLHKAVFASLLTWTSYSQHAITSTGTAAPFNVGATLMTSSANGLWFKLTNGGLWCKRPDNTYFNYPSPPAITSMDASPIKMGAIIGGVFKYRDGSDCSTGTWYQLSPSGVTLTLTTIGLRYAFAYESSSTKKIYAIDTFYGGIYEVGTSPEDVLHMDVSSDSFNDILFVVTYDGTTYRVRYRDALDTTTFLDAGFDVYGTPKMVTVGRHFVFVSNSAGEIYRAPRPDNKSRFGGMLPWVKVGDLVSGQWLISADW
jgi:hypothetical protein